ncbi:three-helix bundle dimerization domain-containing protein [Rhodococcus sp. IEGM 1366]|uniref:three-helix bundle dimerization domain-containing protein n=1 Tax=Rhodococcus sp. IEGM 1366 TaxID=3082223 RepID=UPI0039899820
MPPINAPPVANGVASASPPLNAPPAAPATCAADSRLALSTGTPVECQNEEERQLIRITERLHAKFPHTTGETNNKSVAQAYAGFDDAPISDYVPVLVERRHTHRHRALMGGKHQAELVAW